MQDAKPSKKKDRKAVKIIADVVMALLALVVVLALVIGKANGKPLFFFGYSCLWVQTGSMETTIEAKSYILIQASDGQDVKQGDVITFRCNKEDSIMFGKLITHRVYQVTEDGFLTKGDSVSSTVDDWTVKPSDVVGVYKKNLPVFTLFGRLFSQGYGIILCVAVFVFLCAFCYIPDIVNGLKEVSEQKQRQKSEQIDKLVKAQVDKLKSGEVKIEDLQASDHCEICDLSDLSASHGSKNVDI